MKIFLALSALLVLTGNRFTEAACGYKACPATKSNLVNIHLVPHSHDDTGWLKTFDQYYYGSRNGIQRAGVQYILDSVVQELTKDKARRFIQVEASFFMKWYKEQTAAVQKEVKNLVDEGRLEFTGGAWSMNDEAAVHYQSVIDQFALGLKALSTTFGACARPRVGWQIDPFGHSREMASIFAQMGYDGEFFARMDYVEKNARLNNMTGEMIWKASENLVPERSEIFVGELYNHYSAPPGFCFDDLCSDSPFIDGESYDNNVKSKVDDFITYINKMATHYRSSHLLVPMGDDFNYQNAGSYFKNIDKLIKYVNARQLQGSKINVFYSTPACYLKSLHDITSLTWPNKTQDFFPYSTDWHTYWTGYFTSRPTQKRFERDGNHFLQVTKQLTTIANLTTAAHGQRLDKLREAMGIMQHHDAITGTEKQHVAYDYDRMLTDAINVAHGNARDALQKLTNLTSGEFNICLQRNMSICEYTQNNPTNLVVTVYNPLAHASTQYVRIPVSDAIYTVTDATRRPVRSQLVPVPKEVMAQTHLRPNTTHHELVFEAFAEKVANYYVTRQPKPRTFDEAEIESNNVRIPKRFQRSPIAVDEPVADNVEGRAVGDVVVQNSLIKLTFNSNGILYNVQMNGVNEDVTQQFYYYKGAYGNNGEFKNRSSGAYIFRPNGTEILVSPKATLTIHQGTVVKEVHQHFNDWVSQVIRIYEGVNRVEFEWLVGPIPIQDNIGKEIITRFTSKLNNAGVFYTDSNGREMLKRTRNTREYFKPNLTEAVSGNYYPITARIALQNANNRMALLNDRAQGGSSIKDGQLELMLHRRLLRDDAFGVGEALNETVLGKGLVARGKVYLMLGPVKQVPSVAERQAQQEIHLPFWAFFSNSTKATSKAPPRLPSFSSLPYSVQVLTLEPYGTGERLLRLENHLDKNETSTITFNLRAVFDALGGTEIRETTLDGNMALSAMSRFKFQPDGTVPKKVEFYTSKHVPLAATSKDVLSKFNIIMDPMQIRTFIVKWK